MVDEIFLLSNYSQLSSNRFALQFAYRCHGEEGNVVYQMAKDADLLARNEDSDRKDSKYVRSNGEEIPREISEKLYELFFNIYEGDDFAEEQRKFNSSRGNFFAEK